MENSPIATFMSVSEAISILQKHKSIEHAILEVLDKCNIPRTNASRSRTRKKLLAAKLHRAQAIRRGTLALWRTEAEQKEFCHRLPCQNDIPEEEHVEDDDVEYVLPVAVKCGGRRKAPLSPALGRTTLDKRVDDILPKLQEIADSEYTGLIQFLLIVLAKLCSRFRWKKLAKLLFAVFISMSDIDRSEEMSIEKSGYLIVSQELGRDKYQDLRNTLLSEGVQPQPFYKVNTHFESITPVRIPVTIDPQEGQIGYRFNFEEACKYSVYRALLANNVTADKVPDDIYIGGKDGTDGSGQHFRRATVRVAVKGNILLYSFTPLLVCTGNDGGGQVLWQNPAPNSALTQRPLAVIGAKEDKEEVLRPLIPLIEAEIQNVCRQGFNMVYEGKDIHVSVNTLLSMFDGKMHAALQGTLGAFCQMCNYSKANCHNIEYVQNGFPIDRHIEDMHIIFGIFSTGDGGVVKAPGINGLRLGVTSEPITHRDLKSSLSPTHGWINGAKWFLNIFYHLAVNDKKWGFGNNATARYEKLMAGKAKVQDIFETILGRRIDTADGTGHSGNSLTGNLARRFFGDDCRNLLEQFVNTTHLANIKKLHLNFYVIMRTISSKDRQIDVEKFGNLCTNTYVDILTHFPWVNLTPTVHKIIAHSTELVQNNSCMGVGHLSEEGLEACHKIIRRFRASWTQQTSDDANLKDLLKKLWLVSDPLFYSLRRVIKCAKCGLTGHQRNCSIVGDNSNKSESDVMLEDIFVE